MEINQSLPSKESILIKLKKNRVLRKIIISLLVIWFIFSVAYIIRDQILEFINQLEKNAYRSGIIYSVKSILDGSENCQTVRVFINNRERTLIDVNCLKTKDQEVKLNQNKKK